MKKIPLNNSKKKALCDDQDFDYLMQWSGKWFRTPDGYAAREDPWRPGCLIYMHNEVFAKAIREGADPSEFFR